LDRIAQRLIIDFILTSELCEIPDFEDSHVQCLYK
jgi:hypothetical protein